MKIRLEPVLFFIAAAANVIPVLSGRFFTTMDGPSHLYNVNIISHLLSVHSPFNNYFSINPVPIPNWLGHFTLFLLHVFLPAFLAEKLLILAYLSGLVYSFRWLIKTIEPSSSWLTFIIFPFSYSSLLILGFYNFCLSLLLVFITCRFWFLQKNNLTLKNGIILCLLISGIYFAHLFGVCVLGLFFALQLIWDVFILKKGLSGLRVSVATRQIVFLFLCSLPCTLCAITYLLNKGSSPDETGMQNYSFAELWQRLSGIYTINCFSLIHEQPYIRWIALPLVLLIFLAFCMTISSVAKGIFKEAENNSALKLFWLSFSVIILILLFLIPNRFSAGLMSDRLETVFFLVLIIWIAVQKVPLKYTIVPLATMLTMHFILIGNYAHSIKYENEEATEYEEIGKVIEPYKTVLPISFTTNWLAGHFCDYMGVNNPIIILNNYEADLKWFPILWNDDSLPDLTLGDQKQDDFCYWWKHNSANTPERIDYVVLWQKQNAKDSCIRQIEDVLNRSYVRIKVYPDAELYELKKS